ncbi:alpha-soluble NSF attachment protein-like protein [Aaosphaeria arxii CBS 175.79]|uniref:Alpha-soluble NSF attachment protein-like protein n=1 Tax=Aaosphaeria arxii CBS 175.79 TaxID=1450172 RepID=A0A6A5XV14_9PLEO|nr:alpha-soluble NSF attachment protein-like protein [Aaosphaeria arxii CBS 175.79]KAF2017185.1 alpha-soluble NSF attachment protein-like protein [Aaosphaeria arxii CBS 175.79]
MAGDPRALLRQADKTLQSASGGFSFFGGRADKYEKAAEEYIAAANAFRMQKQGKEAGLAFEKAAQIQLEQLKEPDDHANTMTEAFKAYKKDDPEAAARSLDKAIAHYCSKGAFRRAATHKQNLGELFEIELGDEGRAAAAYEEAASWYESDNAEALANKLWLKTADLTALEGKDYYKAIELYEKVARSSINNNLMRWSVKEYLLKAGICQLCTGDMVGVNTALDRYRALDESFTQQREHQLLTDLAAAVQDGDQEQFSDKLFQYDQLSKLDKWKTTLLLRIKSTIEETGEDFS